MPSLFSFCHTLYHLAAVFSTMKSILEGILISVITMKSLWTQQVKMPEFSKLQGDIKTDVLVVGGGIAGLLCAFELKNAGVDCVLIEADRIGSGTTMHTTAKLTSQHGLIYHKLARTMGDEVAKLYWQANEAGLKRIRELAQQYPCSFETKNNFIFSRANKKQLEEEMYVLQRLGIPGEFLESVDLPLQTAGAVSFANQAQFHPMQFLAQIAENINIYEQTRVKEFIGNAVVTENGNVDAKKIIVATHFPILNKHGGYFIKMYQSRSYLMAVRNTPKPDGMYLSADADGLSFRSWEDYLLVGCGDHRTGKRSESWIPAEKCVREFFHGGEILFRWAAQDCITLDGMPYVGLYSPATPNLYVATGFNKWGMTGAMIAAMILADMVQRKENPFSELFSPSRRILRPQLFVNAVESASNLLRLSGPRCPHLGCKLKWNPTEHSWDCPCHGSRFSDSGKLLDGPATGNMKSHRSE